MCNPVEDAEIIHESLRTGSLFRKDHKALIDVVGRRPNTHLQRVREEYEKLYHKDLVNDIEDNISFNFKKLLIGLVKSYPEYRGEEIHNATKGLKKNKWAFIDFIIGNDPRSVEEFKQFFRQKYGISLVDYLRRVTHRDFEKVLVRAAQARRSFGIEEDKIDHDVDVLYRSGEGHFGTDEETFIDILTSRSYEHLAFVSGRYKQRYKHSLKKAIKKETRRWLKKALLACLDPPAIHWAKRIRYAIKGLGTDDSLLINCFCQCSKPFLQMISVEYQKKFNRILSDDVRGDTSGDYRDLLLTLLDFPETERLAYPIY